MKAIKRRRLSKQSWDVIMQRFEASSATVSEFCAREGLNTASFYRWRSLLGVGGERQVTACSKQPLAPSMQPGAASFIDLGNLASPARDASPGLELRLDLGGGLVLQIARR